jgi:hypothetical protein
MNKSRFRAGSRLCMVFEIVFPLSFCCALVSFCETCAGYQVETANASDFLPKLRQAARDLESLYNNVRIEGTHVATRPGRPSAKDQTSPAPRTVVAKFSYARSEGREKLLLSPPDEAASGTAVVSSGLRKFRLMRKGPGGSWYVDTDVNANDDWPAMTRYRSWLTAAGYSPGGFPRFPEYVNSAEFRIRAVSRVTDRGADLTKVVFEYVPKDPQKPRIEGWLRLDPALSWVIRDYEFTTRFSWLRDGVKRETTVRNKGFVNYTQENGKPVPGEMEVSKYFDNGKTTTDHVNISKFEFTTSPPEEFTLSAFGLGDYELTASQVQTRATYRSAALACGAFLAAFVLFRIGRSIQKGRTSAGPTIPDRFGGSQGV